MVARVGRGECGAYVSSGATTRPGPGRGRAERLVGAPGSERVRAERRAVLLEIVQEVRVVRGVVRVAVEGGVGGVAVASSARARHAPSRDVLAAGGGPAMRRRAAAAQRRGQVLGREHLPRRGVPEVHVRVRRVRENRPRGLGRGGASLEGEGKRGTRGERVVGQQNACVVRDDRMGFFKTRGERGGTITRAPSQTWRATQRETSAATPPRPSPSATRPGSSSHRANRTEDRERQTRHVIIPRRRAKTRWNERAAAVDR